MMRMMRTMWNIVIDTLAAFVGAIACAIAYIVFMFIMLLACVYYKLRGEEL